MRENTKTELGPSELPLPCTPGLCSTLTPGDTLASASGLIGFTSSDLTISHQMTSSRHLTVDDGYHEDSDVTLETSRYKVLHSLNKSLKTDFFF